MICLEGCDTLIDYVCKCRMVAHSSCFEEWYSTSPCCFICKNGTSNLDSEDEYCLVINHYLINICVEWVRHCTYIVYRNRNNARIYVRLLLCVLVTLMFFSICIGPLLFLNEIAWGVEKIIRCRKYIKTRPYRVIKI
jgi:hypothetical protein